MDVPKHTHQLQHGYTLQAAAMMSIEKACISQRLFTGISGGRESRDGPKLCLEAGGLPVLLVVAENRHHPPSLNGRACGGLSFNALESQEFELLAFAYTSCIPAKGFKKLINLAENPSLETVERVGRERMATYSRMERLKVSDTRNGPR